jgi:hypothetical protein
VTLRTHQAIQPTRRPILALAAPCLIIVLLTAVVTWPQCLHMGTRVGAHDDPLFSIWRLAWVAHALATDPRHLLDGNIFYPARNTLTFSDATMLEGLLAAPLFWLGVSPVLIYNILLLGGIAGSGVAMFVLARHLLGGDGAAVVPAVVSAAIFTMAPYRIEHYMHLELQWAMWVPLTLWAIHRAVEERSWRHGILGGLFLWLQILSSVYYGVFLTATAAVFVLLLLVAYPKATVRAMPALLLGALAALVLAVPYALPYLRTGRALGARRTTEVMTYSATLWNYLASAPQSWLWGWTAPRWGSAELSLFPGAVAAGLAIAAVLYRPRRLTFVYASLAAATIELSLGLNGRLYTWMFDHISALHGLRSPSRFGIMACCAIAMLAGFGAQALLARTSRFGPAVSAALVLLVALDDGTSGMTLTDVPYQPSATSNVYKTIRAQGPGVILELPLPRLDALPGREAAYMFWSITHWHPLVNGYSGYYPPEFLEMVVRTEGFPDDRSLEELAFVGVHYVVVHKGFFDADQYSSLLVRMLEQPALQPLGIYPDPSGGAALFAVAK